MTIKWVIPETQPHYLTFQYNGFSFRLGLRKNHHKSEGNKKPIQKKKRLPLFLRVLLLYISFPPEIPSKQTSQGGITTYRIFPPRYSQIKQNFVLFTFIRSHSIQSKQKHFYYSFLLYRKIIFITSFFSDFFV